MLDESKNRKLTVRSQRFNRGPRSSGKWCIMHSLSQRKHALLSAASELQVNRNSPRWTASCRQVMSLSVKIAASNPIALIYEACQYLDCNNAWAGTWLVPFQLNNKLTLAGRLTLYPAPQTHHMSCERTQWLMGNFPLLLWCESLSFFAGREKLCDVELQFLVCTNPQ